MRKVLHVIYSLDIGGGPIHISKLIKDVEAMHYVFGGDGNMIEYFRKELGNDHVFSGNSFLNKMRSLKHAVSIVKPDIIHLHGRGGAILAFLSGIHHRCKNIVYTIHGFHAQQMPFLKKGVYWLFEKALYASVKYYIHVSRVERNEFCEFLGKWVNEEKHLYIPNYVDLDEFKKPFPAHELQLPDPLDKCLAEESEKIRLLFVGRLSKEKGLDIFLDALQFIPEYNDVKIFIIGYGEDQNLYERKLANTYYEKKVFFLGKFNEAFLLMKYFDAIVIPSRKEGLPYVLLETIAAKSTIICTPEHSIKDVLSDSYCYMSNSFTPQAMAVVIEDFLRDYRARNNKIVSGIDRNYKMLEQDFSKNKIVEKLSQIYNGNISIK